MKKRLAAVLTLGLLDVGLWSGCASADTLLTPDLKAYLQKTLGPPTAEAEGGNPTRVMIANVPVSSKVNEVLVYVTGGGWCGATGNCTLFIFESEDGSFRKIAWTPGVKLPIRLLATSTHGRPDFGVWESNAYSAYELTERFDGSRYLRDDKPSKTRQKGKVLISADEPGERLYP